MFHRIFKIFCSWLNDLPFRKNIARRNKMHLIGNRTRTRDKNIFQRLCFEDVNVERFIFFMKNQNIMFIRCSQLVSEDLECAQILVFSGIEHVLIVVCPNRFACGIGNLFTKEFAVFQIFET